MSNATEGLLGCILIMIILIAALGPFGFLLGLGFTALVMSNVGPKKGA
jgi:hypothetical protein